LVTVVCKTTLTNKALIDKKETLILSERNLRGAAVLGGTLFLGRTTALTGLIFELANYIAGSTFGSIMWI